MILVRIVGINGDTNIPGFKKSDPGVGDFGYFSAESFGFGTERELKDSGKAGTSDINVGVVDLQEVSLDKSFDTASTWLARKAIAGSSCGMADIKFVQTIDEGTERKNIVYLHMRLDNVFVKTWGITGGDDERPSESLTLWYNKIAFSYHRTVDGIKFDSCGICSWDAVTQQPWETGAKALPAAAESHSAEG